MGQIIKRINRLIKSEINYSQSKMDIGQYPGFTEFILSAPLSEKKLIDENTKNSNPQLI